MKEYHDSAIAIERIHFPKTDRAVNPKKQEAFHHLQGDGHLLVTAPHAVRYGTRKKPQPSAETTGAIAFLLHETCHCHMLALRKFYGGDPEQDASCIFKEKMAEIIAEESISLVLNIGTLPAISPYDAEVSVIVPGKQKKAESIIKHSCQNLGDIIIDGAKSFSPNSVSGRALLNGAGAIEFSLKKSFRVPRQNPSGFNDLMAALIDFVHNYGLDI